MRRIRKFGSTKRSSHINKDIAASIAAITGISFAVIPNSENRSNIAKLVLAVSGVLMLIYIMCPSLPKAQPREFELADAMSAKEVVR